MNSLEPDLVANKISQLNKEYNSRLISHELQILRPYLQAMETLAVLKTVEKDSQPFALALVLSSLGIFKNQSEIGLIGPSLEKILISVGKCIEALDPSPSVGSKKLMIDGSSLAITGMMTLSAYGAAVGLAHSLYDEQAQKEINTFGIELLLHVGIYSNLPYYLFQTLAEVSKYDPKKTHQIASFLTLTSLLLAIWISSQEKGPKLDDTVASLTPKLKEYCKELETKIDTFPDSIMIVIKKSIFALEANNAPLFIENINSILQLCDVSPEELVNDIKQVCLEIKEIVGLVKSATANNLLASTEMWQAG